MPSEVTKRLRDRRLNVWEECKAIADVAATENRNFSAEEQGKWEVLNEEMDTLDKRIKAALDAEQRSAEADLAFSRLHADAEGKKIAKQPEYAKLNEELRTFLRGEHARKFLEFTKPEASRINWNYGPVNLPEVRKAETEWRTLSTSAGGVGGNLVPTDFYDQLIAHLIEVWVENQSMVEILPPEFAQEYLAFTRPDKIAAAMAAASPATSRHRAA